MKNLFKILILTVFITFSFKSYSQFTIDSTVVTDVVLCYGDATGTITMYVSGGDTTGIGGYFFSIDGGPYTTNNDSVFTFTGLPTGGYFVYAKDFLNQIVSDYVVINQPNIIFIENEEKTDVTGCFGDANGTITITASGGTGTLTYYIDNGTVFSNTSGLFTGLSAGTYSVYVRDENLCQIDGFDLVVGQPNQLVITAENITNIIGCPGSANGSIDIIASGGTSPFQYSINNGSIFQAGHYFAPLAPGNYNSVVKDSKGCTTYGDSVLVVTEPSPVVIDTVEHTDVTGCLSLGNNGTITITASGGTGILAYSIEVGMIPVQNGGVFTDLFAGTYTVKVTDESGCSVTGSEIIITQPDPIIIDSATHQDITTCFGDVTGSITINAHGGSGVFEYFVNPPSIWYPTNTISNLPSGTYAIKVRDFNNPTCEVDGSSQIIAQPQSLSITSVETTNVSTCYGGTGGTIHITTDGGGTQPYQFSIDGGLDGYPYSFDITNLSAGIFNVIVQDAHLCSDTFTTHVVEIFEPDELVISNEIPTDPICFNGTEGQIEVTAIGGTGNIYYSTDGIQFLIGNTLTELSAGISYTIVVKDDHGCTTTGGTYVLGQPSELVIDSISKEDVTDCFGGSNGSITIYAVGGTLPISYSIYSSWTPEPSNIFNGLDARTYFVRIEDANNCSVTWGEEVITQPDPLLISSTSKVDVTGCRGNNNGEIHIAVTGGTPHITDGYQYSVTGGAPYVYNNGDFLNLFAGTYPISVMDEYGCVATGTPITLTQPTELIPAFVSQQNVKCYGNNTGSLNVSVSGGKAPYQYTIDNWTNFKTIGFFGNLTAGTYQTQVKDAYNCIQPGPLVTITQPADTFEIDLPVLSTNVSPCFGNNNGTITINAVGGTPGYMYSIYLVGSTWYNNNTGGGFTNLIPGDYTIKVQDANFCQAVYLDSNSDIDTIHIVQPVQFKVDSIDKKDILCNGDNNGEIHIFTSGGSGILEYFIVSGTYSASNNTGDFYLLPAENYTIHVEDANCSTQNETKRIIEPSQLYVDHLVAYDETCFGSNDGKITVYAANGTPPYEFSADGISFQDNRYLQNLAPGSYTPVIRDLNMCSVISDTTVIIGSPNDASLFTSDVTEGCSPLVVQFERLNAGTTYLWEFGDGEESSFNEPEHTFTYIGTTPFDFTVRAYSVSPDNCLDTAEMVITVYPQPQPQFTASPLIAYYPDRTINITNDTPIYSSYIWDFGDGTIVTDEQPISHEYDACGEYTIIMFAENSYTCSDSTFKSISITAHQPIADFSVDTTQHCMPHTFLFENLSENYESFNWELEDGTLLYDNQISQFYETPGVYTIKLNAFGYCDTFDSFETSLTVFQTPIVDFDVFPDTVMLPNQPIRCYNRSSLDSEWFLWDFGDGGSSSEENPIYQYTIPGTFPIQLTVISENKCIDSLIYMTEVVVLPVGEVLFPNAFTPNGDGINEEFKPALYFSVESFQMEIYNRWGELVFYTEDIETGWTGYFNNRLSLQDVYVWRANGIFLNGSPFEYAGSVTLLR